MGESIARGSALIAFAHDSEHHRYKQMNPTGETLYLAGSGVMAERLLGAGGVVQWTNYLSAGGEMVAMRVDRSDATTYTRYFHKDHLGSIATITDAAGAVVERLSYDAWGKRRFPNGQDDPSGSIASQTTRGFTGHGQLADVGLIHMNGRVYDPMLGRFGTPDPMTENPFSTQGWNRYSYVGNSPLNFTDPSGYCFMGCFWQKPFKALGKLLRRVPIIGQILTVAAGMICGPVCSSITSAVVTGLASGDLGLALKAGFISAATAAAFYGIGELTGGFSGAIQQPGGGYLIEAGSPAHIFNTVGHAAVGCGAAVASGGKCGPGALSAGIASFSGPLLPTSSFGGRLVAKATIGGLASVAGGGKFGNGAATAAFGYLFNETLHVGLSFQAPGGLLALAYEYLTGNEFPLKVGGIVGNGAGAGLVLQYPGSTDGAKEAKWDLGLFFEVSGDAGSVGFMGRITRDVGAGLGTIRGTFEGSSREINAHAGIAGGGVSYSLDNGSFEGVEARFGPGVGISQDITVTKPVFTLRELLGGSN